MRARADRPYKPRAASPATGKQGRGRRRVRSSVRIRPATEWVQTVFHPERQIVSAELWQQANDMAAANAKASRRRSRNPRLLHGLIRCTRQHARVQSAAMFAQQKPGRTPTYACKHRPYVGAPCCNLKVRAEPLEETVWQLVQDIALEPEKLLADFVTACERIVAEQRRARARLAEACGQVAKWEDTIDRLSLAHYAGDLPSDEYRRVRTMAEGQRAQAQAALARLEQETGDGAEALGGLADLLRERVESATGEGARRPRSRKRCAPRSVH